MPKNKKVKPENTMGAVRRLLGEMSGKYRVTLVFVIFFILISALANVAGSFFIRILIDNYIKPLTSVSHPDFTPLLEALLVMAAIYLIGVGSALLYNRMMVMVSQGVQKKIRDQMFAHMQLLPIKYYDTHSHGNLMSLYTNDIDTLREMMAMSFPQLLSGSVTIVAVAGAMLLMNVALSVPVFLCVAAMLIVARVIGGKASRHFRAQQKTLAELNGYVEEMVSGQKVVKVFCHEDECVKGFEKRNEALRHHVATANSFTVILMPIMMNIGQFQYVLIALFGGILAINNIGGVTLGVIASFLMLSRAFSAPIGMMSSQINIVTTALAGAERIFHMLDEETETDEGYVTLVNARHEDGELTECAEHTGLWAWKHPHGDGTVTYTKQQGQVELADVDFGYTEDKIVLHDITLAAKPGQKIAFVGATGAGKTTITNLLNRFYDIADGKIRIDGININKIKKGDLRRSLGIVLQDTNLFTGSVADNIRYGNLSATDEDVRHAAELANAHDFITRLPRGYDTVISGDGGSLSGGQRQLLAIARAAASDPPVMILDEATSSIDTRTESIVQRGMDALMRGRTVFVIAHRLSTVKNADAIMVMDHGRIIERGSHDELIEKKGKYYELYTGAFG